MISLIAPKLGEDRYILFRDFMIGPYGSNLSSEGDVIALPAEMSSMIETKGIWHENHVEHDKVSGDIYYHPFLGGSLRSPTITYPKYPDRVVFPVYLPGNVPSTVTANCGLAIDHRTSVSLSSSTIWVQHAIERNLDNPNLWTIYEISGSGLIRNSTWNAWRYKMTSVDSFDTTYLHCHVEQTQWAWSDMSPAWDGFDKHTFDEIKSYCESIPKVYAKTNVTPLYRWYRARVPNDTVLSPQRIKEHIDAIVAQLVSEDFPILDADYGDLAMIASQKVNANKVNMIAFLRDLRHPTEMIPKLQNLRRLKSLADDYLTVEYGILPTISDVQSIVDACARIAPYLDRNGFQVYTAGSTNSQQSDTVTYTCEQRIKLAIADEDNEFLSLIKRLESMGTLPTFQNIWDLIPYSFVIDWLVDVGGLLQRVDSRLRIMRLEIRYATMSRKAKIEGNLTWDATHNYEGNIIVEQYHRWVSDQCPVPPLSLKSTFQDFNHWLESGALLTQRTKR